MRRVATIALVHETLSQGFDETVDFDEVVGRGFRAGRPRWPPSRADRARSAPATRSGGCAPRTPPPLALVLTELVANAVEHGFAGDAAAP